MEKAVDEKPAKPSVFDKFLHLVTVKNPPPTHTKCRKVNLYHFGYYVSNKQPIEPPFLCDPPPPPQITYALQTALLNWRKETL